MTDHHQCLIGITSRVTVLRVDSMTRLRLSTSLLFQPVLLGDESSDVTVSSMYVV